MTTSSPSRSSATPNYFDLHTTGLGYLNRIREVTPKQGKRADPFLACNIAAVTGTSDATEYRYFDVLVSGADAKHLIRRCMEPVQAQKKVLIGFRLGDLWTDVFTYSKGERAGQTGVSLKARLLYIGWIKVDGQLVYKAAPKEVPAVATRTANPASDETPHDDAVTSPPTSIDAFASEPAVANEADQSIAAGGSF